jgi:MipA family protein
MALDIPRRIVSFPSRPVRGCVAETIRVVPDKRGRGNGEFLVLKLQSRAAVALAFVASVAGSNHATAADGPGYSDSVFSAQRWGVAVGGFVGFQPAYEGASEYRAIGYPLVFPRYYGTGYDPDARSRVAVRGLDDVRVTLLRFGGLDVGPVVGYSFGREENLSARLAGLGDVDGGLITGAFVAYSMDRFFVDFAYNTQITGDTDTGYTLRIGAGIEEKLTDRLAVSAYLNGSYASGDYMDAYFSVTPAQAAASAAGLAVYDAGAGFKNVGLDLGVDYRVTERMTLRTRAGYARLLGEAADSPIVAARDQFTGGLGLTYSFGRID